MTTAARPTFEPAKGGSSLQDKQIGKLSHLVSARDQPAHLKLKERLPGQDTREELKERDFRAELEEREKIAQLERAQGSGHKFTPSLEHATQVRLAIKAEQDKERVAKKEALLGNQSVIDEDELIQKCPNIKTEKESTCQDDNSDLDDATDLSESDFSADDADDGGCGEEDLDSEDELAAELMKIRRERAEEQERQKKLQETEDTSVRSNFADDATPSFSVKRGWDDDVPFRNCARGDSDPQQKTFLNDTLRQESHKKFMDKYIR